MTTWKTMETCPVDTYVLMTNGRATTVAKFTRGGGGRKFYDVSGAGGYECEADFDMWPPAYWMEYLEPPADSEAVSKKAEDDRRDWGAPSTTPVDPSMVTDFIEYLKPISILSLLDGKETQ